MTQSNLLKKAYKMKNQMIHKEKLKILEKQALRFAEIPSVSKMDFDDLLSIVEEISAMGGNGTIEIKVHNYKVTLFKRHHKTYPKKTK